MFLSWDEDPLLENNMVLKIFMAYAWHILCLWVVYVEGIGFFLLKTTKEWYNSNHDSEVTYTVHYQGLGHRITQQKSLFTQKMYVVCICQAYAWYMPGICLAYLFSGHLAGLSCLPSAPNCFRHGLSANPFYFCNELPSKKLVLFESKKNVGAFSMCLGYGNDPCQKEIRALLGELAASFLRLTVNLHNIKCRYRPGRYRKNSISTV